MTQIIGKIGFTPKGEFIPEYVYDELDVVSYEGGSYVSREKNNTSLPTDSEKWFKQSERGAEGPKGDPLRFEDLTVPQKEELKGDVLNYTIMTEAEKLDLAGKVPAIGKVAAGNQLAVSGDSVYTELTKIVTSTPTEVVVKGDSVTSETWTDVGSTFAVSGFGFIIGKHKDFHALTLKIKQRGGVNDTLITKVTVRIKGGGYQGQVLATVVKDVSIAVGSTLDVRFDFPEIKNENNSDIWLEYACNGHAGLIVGNLPVQLNGRYTSTLAMDDFNTSSYLLTGGGPGYKPMYVLLHGNSYSVKINADLLDSEAVENSDKPIKSAVVFDLKSEFYKIIEEKYIETSSVTLGAKSNVYSSSTFAGWGQKFGKVSNFDSVGYTVNAYNAEKIPTYVRLIIRKNTFDGDIMYDIRQDLNLTHNTPLDVYFHLGELFLNENNDDIFISYLSDGYFTLYGKTGAIPNGERVRYTIGFNSTSAGTIVNSDSTMYSKLIKGSFETEISESQLEKILNRVELPNASIELSLPDKIYAVVGDTLQLFFRGIIQSVNPYNYDILVTCSKGKKFPRYFEYLPTISDVGTTTLKIQVKDKDGVILGEKTCQLVTKSVVKSPDNNTIILGVGDSLTTSYSWGKEASRRLTSTGGSPIGLGLINLSFRGRKTGNGVGWEGNGGWDWSSYATAGRTAYKFYVSGVTTAPSIGSIYTNNGGTFTVAEVNITSGSGYIRCLSVGTPSTSGILTKTSGNGDSTITFSSSVADSANPFWKNGQLDFKNYVDTYMGGQVDCIYFLLSWNGQTPHRTDFASMITTAKLLIDHIHINYPACKIKIMGIQIPSLNGGMGANYGATGTSYADGYGMVVTALNLNKAYQDWCNEPAYSSFLEFVNISSQFDSENNMPEADTPVNTRNSKSEKRGTNGVHPDDSGYLQIGDVMFRNIVANYCQ